MLTGGVVAVMAAVVLVASLLADWLAPYIPFSAERHLKMFEESAGDTAIEHYLQDVANRVTSAEALPQDMRVQVHVVDGDTVNAFATLGGHIVFFRGLLKELPNENALAMLVAHEVGHIKYRHPIRSLGRGVVLGVALSLVSSSVGSDVVGQFMGEAGYLSQLSFSRSHEQAADQMALEALQQMYGHVGGAQELFQVLQAHEAGSEPPAFFRTHPLTQDRIARIQAYASEHDSSTGAVVPLPADFNRWLTEAGGGAD